MKKKFYHRLKTRQFKPKKSTYLVITETYLIPLAIIVFVLFSLFLIFKSSLFEVTQIQCQRDGQTCQNDFILSELAKYQHLNIFLFPQDKLKTRLLAGDKTLVGVEFQFKLPHRLIVKLTSTKPKIALRFQPSVDQFLLIDQNLRPISISATNFHLPIVTTTKSYHLQLGQTISDSDLASALTATIKLNQVLGQPFQLKLDHQDLYLYLPQKGLRVRLTTQRNLDSQLKLLQAVLSNVKMLEEEQVKFIDVRFDQPVLKSY